jgi:DNA-binding IclR family transcriptional regulator
MAMLQYHDFVVHDSKSRVYRAGPALVHLGLNAIERMSVRRLAFPFVERLARDLDETVHFVVLDGASVLFVDGVDSGRAVRTRRRRGELRPAHCTSGGKAMLAMLPHDDFLRRYPQEHLLRCTGSSLATREALARELAEIRIRGYATNIQESEPDIAAIGAAIVSPAGKLIGALSIAIPTTRYDPESFTAFAEPLLMVAAEAGEKLAFAELLDLTHE